MKPRIRQIGTDDTEGSGKLIHAELSRSIIGSAMQVLNALGPGLAEKCYKNALVIELKRRGHVIEQQRRFEVVYEGVQVGTLVPDLIVDELVIVDAKVVELFTETHVAQMMGYLAITKLRLALLINFHDQKLGWRRVVR